MNAYIVYLPPCFRLTSDFDDYVILPSRNQLSAETNPLHQHGSLQLINSVELTSAWISFEHHCITPKRPIRSTKDPPTSEVAPLRPVSIVRPNTAESAITTEHTHTSEHFLIMHACLDHPPPPVCPSVHFVLSVRFAHFAHFVRLCLRLLAQFDQNLSDVQKTTPHPLWDGISDTFRAATRPYA